MLEKELDKVFASKFELGGKQHFAIPQNTDLDKYLEKYYDDMKQAKDWDCSFAMCNHLRPLC